MKHSEALDPITGHLLNQEIDHARLQAAEMHVAGCRRCQEQFDSILSLLSGQPVGLVMQARLLLTCDECRERLPEYTELQEFLAASQLPQVARHLATCSDCQVHLTTLRGWLATPLPIPEPPAPSFSERGWRAPAANGVIWQEITAQVRRLFAAIPVRLGASGARLGELVTTLQPLQFAPVEVRGRSTQAVEGLRLSDEANGVRIELRLASQTQLAVRLLPLGSAPLRGQGRVILKSDVPDQPPLQRVALRVGSEATLPLRPGDLLVRIEFDSRIWEIPLAVVTDTR